MVCVSVSVLSWSGSGFVLLFNHSTIHIVDIVIATGLMWIGMLK